MAVNQMEKKVMRNLKNLAVRGLRKRSLWLLQVEMMRMRKKNGPGNDLPELKQDLKLTFFSFRFQKGMNRREKALAGKSRVSHSVHCPYYTDDKQEFW